MQVLRTAGDVFLHQRHADALRDATLDLALGQQRIDRPADIVGGGDLDELYGSQPNVDLEFRDLRAVAVDGVGSALPVGIERLGRRIIAFGGAEYEPIRIDGERCEVDVARRVAIAQPQRRAFERQFGLRRDVRVAQDCIAQSASGLFGRLARDEGLARAGGLAGIRRMRGIGVAQLDIR